MYEKDACKNQGLGRRKTARCLRREDAKREVIEITPLDIPDFIQADTLTDSKIREMEEFFNQFNKEDNE